MGKDLRIAAAAALAAALTLAPARSPADERPAKPARKAKADPAEYRFGMTRAILCESVKGYEDYVERPDARLTADEKLLIYYRPRHFASERDGEEYRAHLVQDARIRRRGEKATLQAKDKLVDFAPKGPKPPENKYITNWISVSDLMPGDYDLDIILHDAIAGSKSPPATQTLRFTIIPDAAVEKSAAGPATPAP